MKVKNKFFIPVIAILIAMLMVGGSVSGVAADTSASDDTSTTHPLTYVPTTYPPTSSLDEEIDAIVSSVIGENFSNPDQVGEDIREQNGFFNKILAVITNVIDILILWAQNIGNALGNRMG